MGILPMFFREREEELLPVFGNNCIPLPQIFSKEYYYPRICTFPPTRGKE